MAHRRRSRAHAPGDRGRERGQHDAVLVLRGVGQAHRPQLLDQQPAELELAGRTGVVAGVRRGRWCRSARSGETAPAGDPCSSQAPWQFAEFAGASRIVRSPAHRGFGRLRGPRRARPADGGASAGERGFRGRQECLSARFRTDGTAHHAHDESRYLVFDIESVADARVGRPAALPRPEDRPGRGGAALSGGADGEVRQRLHPVHVPGADFGGRGQGGGRLPAARRGGARRAAVPART